MRQLSHECCIQTMGVCGDSGIETSHKMPDIQSDLQFWPGLFEGVDAGGAATAVRVNIQQLWRGDKGILVTFGDTADHVI